jgi:hypothetical protein
MIGHMLSNPSPHLWEAGGIAPTPAIDIPFSSQPMKGRQKGIEVESRPKQHIGAHNDTHTDSVGTLD